MIELIPVGFSATSPADVDEETGKECHLFFNAPQQAAFICSSSSSGAQLSHFRGPPFHVVPDSGGAVAELLASGPGR